MNRITTISAMGILVALTLTASGQGISASPDPLEVAAAPATGEGGKASPTEGSSEIAPLPESGAVMDAPSSDPGPKPWALPQPRFFSDHKIKTGGWVQQGITFNAADPPDGFNGPIATNDRSGEYMLNQAWLYFVRPTKTDGCGFDVGGRIDLVYGEDWRFGQCFGLETEINDPNNFYGMVLPQFYLEVAYNDLTVKMGHFATLTSLEVVPAPMNFFYSHSYLMTGYFDPLLATGLQAEYKLNDNWTAVGGFHQGWQLFENPFDTFNFLGGAKWAGDDKRTALSVMVDTGPTVTFSGFHDQTSVITVLTHQFNERFWSGSQFTVGHEPNGSAINPGQDDDWYGFEQMFTLKLNPKWSAGARYEWVRDDEGSRIAGIGNVLGTNRGWNGKPGFSGVFSDFSLGLNYRPHPNFTVRPEVRWDWYSGPQNPFGELPFDALTESDQFTTGMDVLFTF